MSNPFKRFIHDFNNYSRSDRNALLILSGLIILAFIANIIVRNIDPKPMYTPEEYEQMMAEWQEKIYGNRNRTTLFKFNPNTISDSLLVLLNLPSQVKQNILRYRKAGGKFFKRSDLQKIYGMNDSIFNKIEPFIDIEVKPKRKISLAKSKITKSTRGFFNPNDADSAKLSEFGFNPIQIRNLLKYKKRGGYFYSPDDLLKIYGIDSAFWRSIKKHIEIKEKVVEVKPKTMSSERIKVELNIADSAALVKLPGIGQVYAKRIIKYRNLLGGFYSKKQLLEVYGFPEETYLKIKPDVLVNPALIKKIRINFAEYNDLLRHPYFNKKQVKALLNYRDKNGAFDNISAILLVSGIDSVSYQKMQPYLTCR